MTKPIKFAELMQAIEKYAGGGCLVVDPHIEPKLRVLIPGYIESRRRDLETMRAALGFRLRNHPRCRTQNERHWRGLWIAAHHRNWQSCGAGREEQNPETIRAQTDELARFLARACERSHDARRNFTLRYGS